MDFPVQDESPCRCLRSTLIPEKALSSGRAITLSTAMTGRFQWCGGNPRTRPARGRVLTMYERHRLPDLAQDEMLPVLIAH